MELTNTTKADGGGLYLQPWQYENPRKMLPFWFEKTDSNEDRYWARKQLPVCAVICVVYFLFILIGPLLMKNRKPYSLRTPLIIWNLILAVFSIAGTIRMLPELYNTIVYNGFHKAWCERVGLNEPAAFWSFAFTLSKVWELGDTAFLILRKRPLSFLHWFHHCSMVICTFFVFSEGEPIFRWGALLNYSVHSIMYTYYTLRAMKVKVPKSIPKKITSLQIGQFILGLSVNVYTLYVIGRGGDCIRSWDSAKVIISVGVIYLYLFIRLFYIAYIKPKEKENSKEKEN